MMDGHGDGRLKRSGTIWNDLERSETKRNEVEQMVTGRSRFPLKTKDSLYLFLGVLFLGLSLLGLTLFDLKLFGKSER